MQPVFSVPPIFQAAVSNMFVAAVIVIILGMFVIVIYRKLKEASAEVSGDEKASKTYGVNGVVARTVLSILVLVGGFVIILQVVQSGDYAALIQDKVTELIAFLHT